MRSSATILELVNKNKTMEAENKRYRSAQEAICESEERFRLISETIHFGVFEIDDEGSCLYTNTRYQKIFGLSDVQMDYTQAIKRSGIALLALINDILDFSKIESGERRWCRSKGCAC